MANFLKNVRHFYYAEGTAGLVDQVGGIGINEVGTVGENTADGPPPDPTRSSRGPCSQANVGFRRLAAPWGYLDPRASGGVLPRTMAAWWRLDSLTGNQEVMTLTTQSNPGTNFHAIGRYEHAFTTWIVHLHDGTAEVSSGSANPNPVVVGQWNFSGWSYDGAGNVYVHHNGFTHHASSSFAGFQRASFDFAGFGLEHLTTDSGLLGDLAYVMVLDVCLRPHEWGRFWRGGAGLKFPSQFRWDEVSYYTLVGGKK